MFSLRTTKVEVYNSEQGYEKIYGAFRWLLKLALLRIFDDEYMAGPFLTFHLFNMSLGLMMVIYHFLSNLDDVDTVILSLSAFLAGLEMLLKMIGMVYRRKHIVRLLQMVLNDRSYRDGSKEATICDKYQRLARKLLYFTVASYTTTCLMLLIYPVVAGELGQHVLPIGYAIPFVDYRQHPWYLMNYLVQIVQMVWVAIAFMGLDGPFYIFVCYSASQLEILLAYLRQIGQSPDNGAEQRQLIRKVFEAHTRLSEFLLKCSSIFREIFLVQMLCSIGLICVSLFHIQLKLKNGSYGMLLTNVSKVWLFCYCGELVVSKASEFCDAVYANQWYQLWDRKHLRDLLFMLRNAQRNYGFNIGGFGFFSYAMFTVVMKTAYTCNAFLHRVMN